MRVLDLFSGTGGWSQAFLDRGHQVVRIDNDEQFENVPDTHIADVLDSGIQFVKDGFDVVLASPPCQAFSLAAAGAHMRAVTDCRICGVTMHRVKEQWLGHGVGKDHPPYAGEIRLEPKSDFGKLSVQLVERTGDIIAAVNPKAWWMENPNGGMIHFVPPSVPRVQVTYCQYGETRMKLTNLWGNWPSTWTPRMRCRNGDPCHEKSPRGARTGTQGLANARVRAIVPYELSMEVCLACEAAGL